MTILDNLSTGRRGAAGGLPLVVADCRDVPTVEGALSHGRIDAVLHFAGLSQVGASMEDPAGYYAVNVGGAAALLEAMRRAGVGRIVFSSSAAVYGEPEAQPIPETAPLAPVNPYGRSKAMVERMLEDAAHAGQVRAVALRYFNAAGAAADGSLGEAHQPETHLIPRVLEAARRGEAVTVYGSDYPTPDGTAVRDYVHVEDLAGAHAAALEALERMPFGAFNLGTGKGHSVKEVLEAARRITGRSISVKMGARRKGDPPTLVADKGSCEKTLKYELLKSDMNNIIDTAWRWHNRG